MLVQKTVKMFVSQPVFSGRKISLALIQKEFQEIQRFFYKVFIVFKDKENKKKLFKVGETVIFLYDFLNFSPVRVV